MIILVCTLLLIYGPSLYGSTSNHRDIEKKIMLKKLLAVYTKSASSPKKALTDYYHHLPNVPAICLVTISTPNRKPFATKTKRVLEAYAQKWAYDLHYYTGSLTDPTLPITLSKFPALLAALTNTKHYDWVVWIDDDILITNDTVPLDYFIQRANNNHDLIIQEDLWIDKFAFNNGIFFVRNTPWSKNMLTRLLDEGSTHWPHDFFADTHIMHKLFEAQEIHNKVAILPVTPNNRPLQSALTDAAIWRMSRPKTLKNKKKAIQAWKEKYQWHEGDFCAHMVGISSEKRSALIDAIIPINQRALETPSF